MSLWLILLILLVVFVLILILACFVEKLNRIRKVKRKTITLAELPDKARTGDLLLFSCHEFTWIPSWVRKGVYGTEWTHSGILYIDPKSRRPFLWEATITEGNHTCDVLTGECSREGVQLVPLEDKLKY